MPPLQPFPVRPVAFVLREDDLVAVEFLQTVLQHRAIMLLQDVAADFDDIVGVYAEDIAIESGVVDLAKGESVRYNRLAVRLAVSDDVRRVEKLRVFDVTDGAIVVVGIEYHVPERILVKSPSSQRRNIPPQVRLADRGRGLFDCVREIASFDLRDDA